MKGITRLSLQRIAAGLGHQRMAFRRGRVARRRISMQDPKLTELGGNGVDLQIRSAEHPEYPPLNPEQVYMPNPREHYVVVEDLDAGPWMTSSGLFVSVLQVDEDGTIVGDIPADFASEYDEYLATGEDPIGQGEDWARVLDYFNLDVAEIDRWKDEVMENLKTGQVESRQAGYFSEPVLRIEIERQYKSGDDPLEDAIYRAAVMGGSGAEYAITSEAEGATASEVLRILADAWSREGFEE